MEPRLSIVIPTHDRRRLVLRLLDALAAQTLGPAAFEVVVVADGCADGTAPALAARSHQFALRVVEQAQGGTAAARNRGVDAARGDLIVFLDDDTVPAPDFLGAVGASFDAGADVVVARVRVADWVPANLVADEQRAWDRAGAERTDGEPLSVRDVHFAATGVRRAALDAVGGFNDALTADGTWGREDAELAHRLLARGHRVVLRPDVVVDSDCVTDPATTLRRARDLGRNDVTLARTHPEFAGRLFADDLRGARIQRAVGGVVLAAPIAAPLLLALVRPPLTAAVRRGWQGPLLRRLWLVVWSAAWWRGVVDAGGAGLARGARRGPGP